MSWAHELRTKLTAQREKTNWEKSVATVAEDSAGERGANNKTKEERTNRRVKPTSETQQESVGERESKWENERTSERTERRRDTTATCVPRRCLFSEPASFGPRCQLHEEEEEQEQQQAGLGPGGLSVHNIFFFVGRGCSSAATATTAAAAGQGSHISWDNYYNNNNN